MCVAREKNELTVKLKGKTVVSSRKAVTGGV